MQIKTSYLVGILVTLITTTAAHAEPCSAWATASTIYQYEFIEGDFVSNEMLTGVLSGTSSLQSQSDPNDPCDPVTLFGPRLTLTSDYPIVLGHHDAEYLIPGTTYQWAYPDLPLPNEGYHVDATLDPAVISVTYLPGFLLSRSVSPNELSAPGGTQTLTIEITPLEPFVGLDPLSRMDVQFGWDSRFGFDGALIHSPTIISSTSNAPEHSFAFQPEFGNYSCFIGNPVVGTTYTVEVTYTLEIYNGVTSVETAPGVIGRANFDGDWSLYFGNTETVESEGATWQWETENEVQWFSHEGFSKSVTLSGYEIPYQCPNSDNDHDGVPDMTDNCTLVANHSQRDTDGDGFGNFCDPDFDNNNLINFADLSYMKSAFFSADPGADLDGSGLVNFTDLAIVKSMFFGPPGPGDPPFNTVYDFQSIDPLGNGLGWGLGVDDNGNVTGSIDIGGDYIGFILDLDSSVMTYVPELAGLFDLNNAGRGSGTLYDAGVESCFIREIDGTLTPFSPPSQTSGGYANCEGRGINSQGIVSGFEYGEAGFIAFSYDSENDVFEEFLSTAPDEQTIVGQVNDQGQLVGSVFYGTTDQACPGSPVGYYSFRRDADGSVKFFTIEGNLTTRARGIADNGQVTGFFTDETGWQRSYVAVVAGGPGFEDIQPPDYKLLDATDCIADPGPEPYPAGAGQEWTVDAESFGTAIRGDGAVVGVCDGYYVLLDTNNGNEIDWVYLGSSGFIATPIE